MTALLFLLFSLWIGFVVEDRFDFLEENFWVKFSFAIIVGTLFSTWLTFTLSLLTGFSGFSLFLSILLMAIYVFYSGVKNGKGIAWFRQKVFRNKRISFVHMFLLLFIMPFFVFGVWETKTGDILYLGNYTDLSYHLSIVSAFLEQVDFLPQNPQCAGAKMSYHFLVNFHSAILCLGGFNLLLSVIIPQIMYSFALATMLYCFYKLILKNELSVFFSSSLLIMGHIACFNLLFAILGYLPQNIKLDFSSWNSIRTLMLYPFFNFLDPVINYFHPQRPFLFAFPLALILLTGIYRMFLKEKTDFKTLSFLTLLLGLTPLFHIHTFIVFVPVLVVAALFMGGNYKRTFLSLLPLMLAAGQIWFILSQPKSPGFSGFDVHKLGGGLKDLNILDSAFLSRALFWVRVTGFPLILGLAGFFCFLLKNRGFSLQSEKDRKKTILLIFFFIPFLFFLLINFYRFSPSWGDSNKFFLYFEVILCIFAGSLLGSWFEKNRWGKVFSITLIFIAALGPSLLEAYVVISRSGSFLFSACDRRVAQLIRLNTGKDALFLTSNDVIHYVPSLAGRRVVDGAYTWNTGFRKQWTEKDVQRIYKTARQRLVKKYHVTHLLIGPQERRKYTITEKAFEKYELVYNEVCNNESYKIYDVTKKVGQKTTVRKNSSPVYLSDMQPVEAAQDFKPLEFNTNINGGPIILNGRKYEKGLGAHANSEIVFRLNRRFTYFESDAGLDDTEDRSPGSIIFKVLADGELKYKTPVMRWDSETHHIKVNIEDAEELTLMVRDAGDGDKCDHASWAGAVVY